MLHTVNIKMTHVFRHPKFYRIPRDKTDQAISKNEDDGQSERASGPGHKPQAASSKLKETSCPDDKNPNPQASSDKLQAPSRKRQASSRKRQAP